MIDIQIKIIGPGMCISDLVNELEDYLKFRGNKVSVKNDYPSDIRIDKFPANINIIAIHQPWGG